jgi:polar amino acid transport system substrate-binding protein
MEEEPDASESDADGPVPSLGPSPARSDPAPASRPAPATRILRRLRHLSAQAGRVASPRILIALAAISTIVILGALVARRGFAAPTVDGLEHVRRTGRLLYGSDMEGGGPYAYPEPDAPRGMAGFEVDLMERLAGDLCVEPAFSQGQWDKLLQVLDAGQYDCVVNGYEWTERRAHDYLATRPYYVYQLQLMVRRGSPLRSWADLKNPKPGGGQWTVGVLVGSAADTFAAEEGSANLRAVRFDGATDAMTAVQNGQYDATLQDLPAARFYAGRYAGLEMVGPPESHGYYVIYVRAKDRTLRDALDQGIARMVASGDLRRLYERYGIWTEAQDELTGFKGPIEPAPDHQVVAGWPLVKRYLPRLLDAAWVTVVLSVSSMPIAMALGLLIAIGRLYGPPPMRVMLSGYIELIRGTPLMLQLFVLFYLMRLPPWVAGISGLAINYSAYEAEIYRAGLQAIPPGQMEAALALGMSRVMALRRVIVPQAVRIVIPPVTNDFIALFKDTSVCSVITLVELTKEYSILANSTGGAIEFAIAAAVLYMLMSVPLSWFSRWSERRLSMAGVKGGALA